MSREDHAVVDRWLHNQRFWTYKKNGIKAVSVKHQFTFLASPMLFGRTLLEYFVIWIRYLPFRFTDRWGYHKYDLS